MHYLQAQQMQSLQQGQLQQMVLQNQTSQSYEQSQVVKPTQTQPLDFSQSSSPMDCSSPHTKPTTNFVLGQHITYLSPYSALTQTLIPE